MLVNVLVVFCSSDDVWLIRVNVVTFWKTCANAELCILPERKQVVTWSSFGYTSVCLISL